MSQNSKTERRKHNRIHLTNLVAYRNFDIEQVSETVNISLGGMKIKTEFPVEKDQSLDVALSIGSGTFRSTARVIYCFLGEDQTYDVGLRFEDTSPRDLTLLRHYLSQQS